MAWRRTATPGDHASRTYGATIAAPPVALRFAAERATGVPLDGVRLHTGDDVDHAARSVGALAFTTGRDIHVDSNAFRPGTPEGNELVAHELTHAAQQRAVAVPPGAALAVGHPRGAAEHQAEAMGRRIAQGAAAPATQAIAAQPAQVARKVSFYEKSAVTFDVTGATSQFVKWQARGYWKEQIDTVYDVQFMGTNRFDTDAEERDALTFVIWQEHLAIKGPPTKAAVETFVQIPPRDRKTTDLFYRLKFEPGDKRKKTRPTVTFEFLGTSNAALSSGSSAKNVSVPKDYRKKDFFDFQLEGLQARKTDKLGAITGMDTVPSDERQAVEYSIFQYFEVPSERAGKKVKARDFEVDSIVPLPDGRKILYSFDFEPTTNNVIVKRVGQEGKDVDIDPAKRRLDIRRVKGFDPKADAAAFSSWVTNRYKGLSPKGASKADRIGDVNKTMNSDADKKSWFSSNYKMTVMDATGGAAQLAKVGFDTGQQKGTKPFTTPELRLVELSLQLLGDMLLDLVRGISLVRQAAKILRIVTGGGKPPQYKPKPETAGESFSSPPTVVLFDQMNGQKSLFIGDRTGADVRALPMSAEVVTHELGHLVGWSVSAKDEFNKLFVGARAKLKTAPVTAYAMTDPSGEFFPEAFAIYQADPAWLEANLPDMFHWFQKLESSGKAPPPPP